MPLTVVLCSLLLALVVPPQEPAPSPEALWDAARAGDTASVVRILDAGVDVNATTRYGATALIFAADKGGLEVVRLLVTRGADVNARDRLTRVPGPARSCRCETAGSSSRPRACLR